MEGLSKSDEPEEKDEALAVKSGFFYVLSGLALSAVEESKDEVCI